MGPVYISHPLANLSSSHIETMIRRLVRRYFHDPTPHLAREISEYFRALCLYSNDYPEQEVRCLHRGLAVYWECCARENHPGSLKEANWT
ncbi:hypothetical protein [Methylohalobius crimeensis]|uniref:hypothetical protein n=1 Tax=Methylohalobius crimeensis TaxID=244365 RepID=UPI0003B445AD|nr:hypothetical protein [Methylohalobius crimeensis]